MRHKDLLLKSVALQRLAEVQRKTLDDKQVEEEIHELLDELDSKIVRLQNMLLDGRDKKLDSKTRASLKATLDGLSEAIGKDFNV
jgi:hypothetical protein